MKKIYALCLGIFVLYSCSKNETIPKSGELENKPETEAKLKACFTLTKSDFEVGDLLTISNCSEGDIKSYYFDLGNDIISLKENPEILLEVEGDFNILLTITDNDDKKDTFSKSISVAQPLAANYIFPTIASGVTAFPLETGITPNNTIYYLELTEDLIGSGGSKFNYRELDENYERTSHYILDKQFNTNSGFANFLSNGNMNFNFSRTLPDFYGSHEITFDDNWSFISSLNSSSKHNYGFIPDGGNSLYFGTQKEDDIYKTSIERKNANGDTFEEFVNSFGASDAIIMDMIPIDNGSAAFGAIFTKNTSAPQVSGYKPILIFYDNALNVTSHTIYENSVLSSKITSMNDLNGAYHLEKLTNGNYVMYGNGELIVANSSGVEITSTFFEETANNQALISLGDSFIISTNDYLRKFDSTGNETKTLKYGGNYLPEIIQKNGNQFFVAGYDVVEDNNALVKLFYGAMDDDLNLINLN